MLTLQTKTRVPGLTGQQLVDFFLHCDDADYQRWWPGTHLRLHTVTSREGGVGNVVYMDEWVAERRLRAKGVVTALGQDHIAWQAKAIVRWPIHLALRFEDTPEGVVVTHTVRAGLRGAGRILDPLLRLWLTRRFAAGLDEHVRTEFERLGTMLQSADAAP